MDRYLKKITLLISLILISLPLTGCAPSNLNIKNINMKLTSPVFEHNGDIPSQYTCDGGNFNPPLTIAEVPENAQSLVLIVDDPDAPNGDWVHWLVWNIDPKTTNINEKNVPADAIEGLTSFNNRGYGGPCPPSGQHRYFFKLYALDRILDLDANANKNTLLQTIEGYVLDSVELIGLYQRQN